MYQDRDENMILCPYNRYHVISKLRIQKHIIKCKKNYPNVKLATCFYNYTHRIKPEDMLKHYEICSHKIRVEGSRYYEPGTYNPVDASVNNDDLSFNFPKTAVRTPKHFYNPCKIPSCLPKTDFEYDEDSESSNIDEENLPKTDFPDSDDEDDDLKPLPLPKTVSKAFTCFKQQQEECSTNSHPFDSYQAKGFGRAKIIQYSDPKQDVSEMEIFLPKRKISVPFSRRSNASCCASIGSSMFDDNYTLKSQKIIFGDEDDDEDDDDDDEDDDVVGGDDDDDDSFISKNLEMHLKI